MNASITSNYIYNIYLKFKMKKLLLVVFVVCVPFLFSMLEARLRFGCYIYSNGMLPWYR